MMTTRSLFSTAIGLVLLAPALLTTQSQYEPWSPAAIVDIESQIDPASANAHVTLSKDGTRLYFTSNRREPDSLGGFDIWMARWDGETLTWGAPAIVPNVNSPMGEFTPALSRDGHWLFFCSNRAGSLGRKDLYVSYREQTHDDTAWGPPVHLGPAVNSAFDEFGVTYFEDDGGRPQLFFASTRSGTGDYDLYVSEQGPDGTFGEPTALIELNTSAWELQPAIRHDGRELLFTAPGSFGAFDLWVSTRDSIFDSWRAPVLLGPEVNTTITEASPALSGDGLTLGFTREITGTSNGTVWITHRPRHSPK